MRKCLHEKHKTKRGSWSEDEDEKLLYYINTHGEGCWSTLPQASGLQRSGKSCKLRWMNFLRPGIKRGNFSPDEEDLIIKLHALLGNKWSLIAGRLPRRSDNEVKNYWNSHIKRKLIRAGIDPNNHHVHQKITTTNTAEDAHSSTSISMSRKEKSDNDRVRVCVDGDEALRSEPLCLQKPCRPRPYRATSAMARNILKKLNL